MRQLQWTTEWLFAKRRGAGSAGVYIIWRERKYSLYGRAEYVGSAGRTTGSGRVYTRLRGHTNRGGLFSWSLISSFTMMDWQVSWAEVEPSNVEAVEHYLCLILNPLLGERKPQARFIPTNPPDEMKSIKVEYPWHKQPINSPARASPRRYVYERGRRVFIGVDPDYYLDDGL